MISIKMLSLLMHLSNNTTASVLSAVVFYACVYIYLLVKNDEIMTIFMKVIPYIICIDVSFFIFILFQKEIEKEESISQDSKDDINRIQEDNKDASLYDDQNITLQDISLQDDQNITLTSLQDDQNITLTSLQDDQNITIKDDKDISLQDDQNITLQEIIEQDSINDVIEQKVDKNLNEAPIKPKRRRTKKVFEEKSDEKTEEQSLDVA